VPVLAGRACSERLPPATTRLSDTPARVAPLLIASGCPACRSGRMPRESLDALEDLPKESPGQVALGQLDDEVPRMADEASAGLEDTLL